MRANRHSASRCAIGRKKVERQRKQWHDGTVFSTAMKHVIKANRIIAASVVLIFLATGVFGVALVWTSVYALPEGANMVFSASPGSAPPAERDVAWDRQHVGLTVATRAELEQWIQKLKTHNVEYQLIDDERIYFADPDGLVLELEIAEHVTRNLRAPEILAQWVEANR